MKWKRTCLVALLTILIVGTSCAAPRSINEESISPIDQRWGLVLLQNLKVRSLAMFDPEKGEIVRQIALGRFAADYAFAPNGKIYIYHSIKTHRTRRHMWLFLIGLQAN